MASVSLSSAGSNFTMTGVNSDVDLDLLDDQAHLFVSIGSATAVNAPVTTTRWFMNIYLRGAGPADTQTGLQLFTTDTGQWVRSFTYGNPSTYGSWDKVVKF